VPAAPSKGPRYTPVSRRGDRPDAIAWLLRYHPEMTDAQLMKLVGTTKSTIEAIRDRTHWNSANIKPVDPVSLGLCTQLDLDLAVQKAARKSGRVVSSEPPVTLVPASEVIHSRPEPQAERETAKEKEPAFDPDSVFAKLKTLKTDEAQ
jgi:hypothetical protein